MSTSDTLEHLADPPGFNEIDPALPGYLVPLVRPLRHYEHSWDAMWRGTRQQAAKRRAERSE